MCQIGKISNEEVDFIAATVVGKMYIQVTDSLPGEQLRRHELAPPQRIQGNDEKAVLSLGISTDSSYDGIKSCNIVDWPLEE